MEVSKNHGMVLAVDIQRILTILLQVYERPKTLDELGLKRQDVLEFLKTGYFEWKRVLYPTEMGYELARWLLDRRKDDGIEVFKIVKQEALRRMTEKGNKIMVGMKLLQPIHIHIMEKIQAGQPVYCQDVEKKPLKDLLKWELLKRVGKYEALALTKLGKELLECFDDASKTIRPKLQGNGKEVMKER